MKTHLIILALGILACNNSAGSKDPATDSTSVASLDTPSSVPMRSDSTTDMKVKDTSTLAGMWFLQPVLISDTATGKIPRLQFDLNKLRFTGNTGCNSMSGSFVLTDSSMAFNKDIITTRMACIGYNEKAFLENMVRTNRYKLENGTLILLFDETELSRWTRKVAPRPVSNKT